MGGPEKLGVLTRLLPCPTSRPRKITRGRKELMVPRQFLDEWQKNRRCKNLAKFKSSGSMILDKSNKKSIWNG